MRPADSTRYNPPVRPRPVQPLRPVNQAAPPYKHEISREPATNHNQYQTPVAAYDPPHSLHVDHTAQSGATASHYPTKLKSGSDTISVRLTIPNPCRIKLPPIFKDYPAFWWLVILFALLVFTFGYQVGWHRNTTSNHTALVAPE